MLNKEGILAMEGLELDDALASKLMNWEQGGDDGEVWLDKDGHCTGYFVSGRAPGSSDFYWQPSRDISAAWQVLRKLNKDYWCIEIRMADTSLIILELLKTPPIKVEIGFRGVDGLPEAICKSALIAILHLNVAMRIVGVCSYPKNNDMLVRIHDCCLYFIANSPNIRLKECSNCLFYKRRSSKEVNR